MVARQAHNLEAGGSSPPPATKRAGGTCEPGLSAPAAAGSSPDPAAALRLHDAGIDLATLGAKFRVTREHISRLIQTEMKRRADRWATSGPSLGWPDRGGEKPCPSMAPYTHPT